LIFDCAGTVEEGIFEIEKLKVVPTSGVLSSQILPP